MILQGFDTEGYIRLVTAFFFLQGIVKELSSHSGFGEACSSCSFLPSLFCCCLLEASSCRTSWLLWQFLFSHRCCCSKKSWLSRPPLTVSMLGLDAHTYPKMNRVPSSAGWSRHPACVYLLLPQHMERRPEKAWPTVPKLLLVKAVEQFSFTERHFN